MLALKRFEELFGAAEGSDKVRELQDVSASLRSFEDRIAAGLAAQKTQPRCISIIVSLQSEASERAVAQCQRQTSRISDPNSILEEKNDSRSCTAGLFGKTLSCCFGAPVFESGSCLHHGSQVADARRKEDLLRAAAVHRRVARPGREAEYPQ